ncbi:MAG: signal peptidase II [Labilithrix sp.]|nr:signal peptidase II [Labilithrix sp.]
MPIAEEPPIAPGVERPRPPPGTAEAIRDDPPRPSPTFLAVVSIVSLVSDVGTKLWAEKKLADYPGYITVIENHLMFVLAKNKGGAWGLLQGESENVRRPFFLLVSVAAIAFIVTLYRRLQPRQHALKWGLPLVLGGALGNVFDRIRYGYVIDFIDYRADWIKSLNELIGKYYPRHVVTDHWPTFNVADIAICVGVALMAIDMLTSRRGSGRSGRRAGRAGPRAGGGGGRGRVDGRGRGRRGRSCRRRSRRRPPVDGELA